MTIMPRSRAIHVLSARRAVVARLAWRRLDVALACVLYPLPLAMWLWPYALADVADTVIGPAWLAPVLLSLIRLGIIVFGIQASTSRRASSWWLRGIIAAIAVGIIGNWARDKLYDTPLTLSSLILLLAMGVLIWRLQVVDGDVARRKVAEQRATELRLENQNLRAEIARLRRQE